MTTAPRSLARWLFAATCAASALPCLATTMQVFPDSSPSGTCKLRAAVQAANTNTAVGGCQAGTASDTLVLALAQPYVLTGAADDDANATGDLDITSTITIQGASTQSVIVAPDSDRAFHVLTSLGSLTLNDVTIVGGSVLGGTSNDGGVVRKEGAATLTINRSTLRGGTADLGGGIYAAPGAGLLTINRVSVLDNLASNGGGLYLGQGSGVDVALSNLTLSGNTATGVGGGMFVSTGWFRLRNATVARNRGASAGGIFYGGVSTTGINLSNSIVVENTDVNGAANDLSCAGGGAQLGARAYTMIGGIVGGCTFASFAGSTTSSDARLSPLFDFGSGVPTHLLLPGSSALGAGNPSNANPLTACSTADARGVPRSASCDLGAYEEQFDRTVNSFSDLPDLNPGDGVCLALGGVCTLRAALMEFNATGGRSFVYLPPGVYVLNRPFPQQGSGDDSGGDLDVRPPQPSIQDAPPPALTLFGSGDPEATQIVGTGLDRVLEVRGSDTVGQDRVLSFALINASISGGLLTQDPFAFEINPVLGGGGIKVYGGKSLFHNVVVRDNEVSLTAGAQNSSGGGVAIRFPSIPEFNRPYAYGAMLDRFAIIDNTSAAIAGGIDARNNLNNATPSDGIVLTNGTISGNHAIGGGGAYLVNTSMGFVTIARNTAVSSVVNPTSGYAAGFTGTNNVLRNVLIADNLAAGAASDCRVYTTDLGSNNVSLGYNLIGTIEPACVISGATTGNLYNVDPLLGAREVLPSGMPVHRLAANSPAANVIPRAACSDVRNISVTSDVLGAPRPATGSALCDIGAVEIDLPIFSNGFE